MPIIKIHTNFNIDLEFEAAEFPRRFSAWFVDLLLQILYLVLITKILGSIYRGSASDRSGDLSGIASVFVLPYFLYHVVSEIAMNGQSLGKKLMKIRVVNENGGKASISQYIIRWLIRTSDLMILVIVFYLATPGVYGFQAITAVGGAIALLVTDIILTASSKKAQRLGDMLAGTIVIRTNSKGSINDTVFLEVADSYIPSFPQIMQLSDKDINAVKSILDTSVKKGDFHLAALATEKIKAHLKIESSLSPFDFLEIVMKDYNYLSTK